MAERAGPPPACAGSTGAVKPQATRELGHRGGTGQMAGAPAPPHLVLVLIEIYNVPQQEDPLDLY